MDLLNLVDLNEIERETYEQLYNNFQKELEEVKDNKDDKIQETKLILNDVTVTSRKGDEKIIKLQARIENLMGLEVLFEGSEMAERQYQLALQNLNKQKERNQK